ncbi:uncharacterized protein CLUP02_03255 [Colletotrichum lupini]|uniref:Uncharacterized protein n=1 Tax=Colletotrichum lupini TaxID=145971 RepID=A0A9Q8WC05_9PEZI|nr:uncharacterized protein CLUP02_03255 [Colletotrichum lupini]UQC77784.1 hypothetical protein CLUP02_03255 [Colletotrichum lupini]
MSAPISIRIRTPHRTTCSRPPCNPQTPPQFQAGFFGTVNGGTDIFILEFLSGIKQKKKTRLLFFGLRFAELRRLFPRPAHTFSTYTPNTPPLP